MSSLFDALDDAPPQAEFPPGSYVRVRDRGLGRVVLYVPATERAFVALAGPVALPVAVHRTDLEPVAFACKGQWEPTVTAWDGEAEERATFTCRCCGFVRGRG